MNNRLLKITSITFFFIVMISNHVMGQQQPFKGGSGVFTRMVWSDEFNTPGLPDTAKWQYEKGHVRNKELQFYTEKAGNLGCIPHTSYLIPDT